MPYAGAQEIYDLGFTAEAFVVRPRSIDPDAGDALDSATGTFRMIAHGYSRDATSPDMVQMVLIGAGAVPGGAVVNTPYYPLFLDSFRFRLAASPNGAALTFANAGSGAWALQIDPERRILRIAENVSSDIDQDLTAHATPILRDPQTNKYPEKLVGVVARETARRAVAGLEFQNPQFRRAKERVDALQAQDDAQREMWRKGEPVRPMPLDQSTIADNGARAGFDFAPTEWRTGML